MLLGQFSLPNKDLKSFKGVNLGKGTTAFSNTVGAADTDAVKRLFVQGKETGRRS